MSSFELEKIYLAIKDSNEEMRNEIRKAGLLIAAAIADAGASSDNEAALDRSVCIANCLLDRIDEENS